MNEYIIQLNANKLQFTLQFSLIVPSRPFTCEKNR